MSAPELREAASLMRERAQTVLDTDHVGIHWVAEPRHDPDNNGSRVAYAPDVDGFDNTLAHTIYDYDGTLATHVSGWHPAVALAVAAWLDAEADRLADLTHAIPNVVVSDGVLREWGFGHALDVARAYVRGAA